MISKQEFLGEHAKASSSSKHGSRRGYSATDIDAKANLAFKGFDKNNDGFVTKAEMLKNSKHLTKKQVRIKTQS